MSEIVQNNVDNKSDKPKKDPKSVCLELDNIKYKTMLEHGAKSEIVPKSKSNNAKDIEAYLEKEKNNIRILHGQDLIEVLKLKNYTSMQKIL